MPDNEVERLLKPDWVGTQNPIPILRNDEEGAAELHTIIDHLPDEDLDEARRMLNIYIMFIALSSFSVYNERNYLCIYEPAHSRGKQCPGLSMAA